MLPVSRRSASQSEYRTAELRRAAERSSGRRHELMKSCQCYLFRPPSIMSVSPWVCLLPLIFYTCLAVGAKPASPQNVNVLSLNTNYTLTWDWDHNSSDALPVSFTTEYIPRFKLSSKKVVVWNMACEESPRRSCDLTPLDLHYLSIFILRVRANVNGSHSDWVQKKFCPDTDAAVGPPSKVDLGPAGGDLDVFISDPLTSANISMKEDLRELYYHIRYWEKSEDTQVLRTRSLNTSVNMVTLPNLKSWTWYCVSIQTRYDFYNKYSSFTNPLCMQTQGTLPWWQIVLYFLASLLVFFVLMLLILCGSFWCYRTVKSTLYPPIHLPKHFQEYLHDSPGSDVPRLLTPDSESELLCEVTVCPEPLVLEVHQPPPEALEEPHPDLEPDIRHSRQDSGGSNDSGIYSTGGSSGLRPCPSLSHEGGRTSCQDIYDPQQVKMRDMTPGIRSQLIIDEGVLDMSV
ncbi:interleukin-10 receptor subunit beta isoform X3 [Labrus mixtus]|uniref:interleukin-10 receptor subunit beta isoform X3 n=1 Tax=Labrus mixtus TaxID=508554 RepID=UPI0029C06F12|nr:interleukin-10 receptor subunit beta isoform X3 [Labrus mixtus]